MYTAAQLAAEPERFVDLSNREAFSIPPQELAAIQLKAVQKRFEELAPRVSMLGRLAHEQSMDRIGSLEALAPLLVPHSAYKSYPMSALENARFDIITRWLGGFTTVDVSGVDARGCQSIDDWMIRMETETPIRIVHSSGTSGKLSFLPRTEGENERVGLMSQMRLFEGYGDEPGAVASDFHDLPVVYFSYRKGGMGQQRRMDAQEKFWHRGNGTPIITLYPGRLSADAMSLGGRLAVAESRGELGTMKLAKSLLERRDALMAEQADREGALDRFYGAMLPIKGRRVYSMGSNAQYFDMATEGLKRGYRRMFSPDSFFVVGGGNKGRDLPDDWKDTVAEFLGGRIRPNYGMSEIQAGAALCPQGYYHMQPWVILYQLDSSTGAVLPRAGTVTGRLGVFDLCASTYWGGFLTGDEVTINWADQQSCGCGRQGPYLHDAMRRYTEQEGGDDKITCAGAPQAHDRALEFVLSQIV
jgi:hypothetical protein